MQGSELKVRLQTPCIPNGICQFCALFKFKTNPNTVLTVLKAVV